MKKIPDHYSYELKTLLSWERALYAFLTAIILPVTLLSVKIHIPSDVFEKYKIIACSAILCMLAFSLLCFSLECQAHEDYRRRHEDE